MGFPRNGEEPRGHAVPSFTARLLDSAMSCATCLGACYDLKAASRFVG